MPGSTGRCRRPTSLRTPASALAALTDASAPTHPLTRDPDPELVAGTLGAVVMSGTELRGYPEDDRGVEGYRLGPLTCFGELLPTLDTMLDELDGHEPA